MPGALATDVQAASLKHYAVVPTIIVPGVPGGGGVRLEDVVVVTEDGPDVLTRHPYSAALLAR